MSHIGDKHRVLACLLLLGVSDSCAGKAIRDLESPTQNLNSAVPDEQQQKSRALGPIKDLFQPFDTCEDYFARIRSLSGNCTLSTEHVEEKLACTGVRSLMGKLAAYCHRPSNSYHAEIYINNENCVSPGEVTAALGPDFQRVIYRYHHPTDYSLWQHRYIKNWGELIVIYNRLMTCLIRISISIRKS